MLTYLGLICQNGSRDCEGVVIQPSQKRGWGVFAAKDFAEGDALHESPGAVGTEP